jgi:hypothetical protein
LFEGSNSSRDSTREWTSVLSGIQDGEYYLNIKKSLHLPSFCKPTM